MNWRISLESPDQPQVLRLIDELDAYQKPLYPPESHHGIDLQALLRPNVLFAVIRDAQRTAVGCGAIVLGPQHGELKRMYVQPALRGRGAGAALLQWLEQQALLRSCTVFVLETGVLQHAALTLYARARYTACEPFDDYLPDPHSVFLRKVLTVNGV
jgi:putative acetyltransferase